MHSFEAINSSRSDEENTIIMCLCMICVCVESGFYHRSGKKPVRELLHWNISKLKKEKGICLVLCNSNTNFVFLSILRIISLWSNVVMKKRYQFKCPEIWIWEALLSQIVYSNHGFFCLRGKKRSGFWAISQKSNIRSCTCKRNRQFGLIAFSSWCRITDSVSPL